MTYDSLYFSVDREVILKVADLIVEGLVTPKGEEGEKGN